MSVGQVLNISFDMGMCCLPIRSGSMLAPSRIHVFDKLIWSLAAWEIFSSLCNGGTLVVRGSKWEPTIREVSVCAGWTATALLKSG